MQGVDRRVNTVGVVLLTEMFLNGPSQPRRSLKLPLPLTYSKSFFALSTMAFDHVQVTSSMRSDSKARGRRRCFRSVLSSVHWLSTSITRCGQPWIMYVVALFTMSCLNQTWDGRPLSERRKNPSALSISPMSSDKHGRKYSRIDEILDAW